MGISLPYVLAIYMLSRFLQICISLKAGKIIDRVAPHKLLSIGYLAGLFSLLLLLANNLVCFIFAFISVGIYDVITLNIIRSYIGKTATDKGATFGALYFVVAITSALGVYVLSLIWQNFGSQITIFIASAGMLFSGMLIIWLVIRNKAVIQNS